MSVESLKKNILDVIEKIEKIKPLNEVVLVGATKTRDITVVEDAVRAGLSIAGENRVQEFLSKYKPIEGLSWHFIGALQTNKVKYIVDKVDLIHSVDRFDLAKEINRKCQQIDKVMPILIEVNVGGEASKSGINPQDLFDFIEQIKDFKHLQICGLMSVLPKFADESLYKQLSNLFEETKNKYPNLPLRWLSMGMSGDYEIALKNGANMIRLGTILFGERDYTQTTL